MLAVFSYADDCTNAVAGGLQVTVDVAIRVVFDNKRSAQYALGVHRLLLHQLVVGAINYVPLVDKEAAS